ncbi:MAG: HD domain-containing protein [Bacilli bacterium]|jgi:uncharacterized protein
MKVDLNNKEYKKIVGYIFKNKRFMEISNYHHHGTDRLTHSIRVSYFSYKLAKSLKLDYKSAAIGGLLHDFFHEIKEETTLDCIKAQYNHPKKAAENALYYFKVSPKIVNIIETHMFPLTYKPSKYLEGWIVSFIDKMVGTYEYGLKFKYQFSLWAVFLSNLLMIKIK